MNTTRLLAVLSLALVLPACGTIAGGSRQTISVASVPDGATVTTNPITADYTTPAQIRLERKNSYTLTFEKDGYTSEKLVIERSMRTGVLIADIILFPIGVIVTEAALAASRRISTSSGRIVKSSSKSSPPARA